MQTYFGRYIFLSKASTSAGNYQVHRICSIRPGRNSPLYIKDIVSHNLRVIRLPLIAAFLRKSLLESRDAFIGRWIFRCRF